jgi:hypothetical protein
MSSQHKQGRQQEGRPKQEGLPKRVNGKKELKHDLLRFGFALMSLEKKTMSGKLKELLITNKDLLFESNFSCGAKFKKEIQLKVHSCQTHPTNQISWLKIRTSSVKTVIGQVTAELQTIFHWLLFETQKGKPYENLKSTDIDVEVVGLESQIHTRVADVVRISDQILHTDFPARNESSAEQARLNLDIHAHSAIVTGPHSAVIYLIPKSHLMTQRMDQQNLKSGVVFVIPPFSIFLFSGFLSHCTAVYYSDQVTKVGETNVLPFCRRLFTFIGLKEKKQTPPKHVPPPYYTKNNP